METRISHIASQFTEESKSNTKSQLIDIDSDVAKKFFSCLLDYRIDEAIKLFPTKTIVLLDGSYDVVFATEQVYTPQLIIKMLDKTVCYLSINIDAQKFNHKKINENQKQRIFSLFEDLHNLQSWIEICKKHQIVISDEIFDRMLAIRKSLSDLNIDTYSYTPDKIAAIRKERDDEIGDLYDWISILDRNNALLQRLLSIILMYCKRMRLDIQSALMMYEMRGLFLRQIVQLNDLKYIDLLLSAGVSPRMIFINYLEMKKYSNEVHLLMMKYIQVEDFIVNDSDKCCILDRAIYYRCSLLDEILIGMRQKLSVNQFIDCLRPSLFQAIRCVYLFYDYHAMDALLQYELDLTHVYSGSGSAAEYAESLGLTEVADKLIQKGAPSVKIFKMRKDRDEKLFNYEYYQYLGSINSTLKSYNDRIEKAKLVYEMDVKPYSLGLKPWLQSLYDMQDGLRKRLLAYISCGDLDGVIALVEQGADLNFLGVLDGSFTDYHKIGSAVINVYGMPPLFFAAFYSDHPVLMFQLLLKLGASVVNLHEYTQNKFSLKFGDIDFNTMPNPICSCIFKKMDFKLYEVADRHYRMKYKNTCKVSVSNMCLLKTVKSISVTPAPRSIPDCVPSPR